MNSQDQRCSLVGRGGRCLPGQSLPLEDENVTRDDRNGCTPLCMCLVSLGCTLYMMKYVCVCRQHHHENVLCNVCALYHQTTRHGACRLLTCCLTPRHLPVLWPSSGGPPPFPLDLLPGGLGGKGMGPALLLLWTPALPLRPLPGGLGGKGMGPALLLLWRTPALPLRPATWRAGRKGMGPAFLLLLGPCGDLGLAAAAPRGPSAQPHRRHQWLLRSLQVFSFSFLDP